MNFMVYKLYRNKGLNINRKKGTKTYSGLSPPPPLHTQLQNMSLQGLRMAAGHISQNSEY